jgi:hypothetical protein
MSAFGIVAVGTENQVGFALSVKSPNFQGEITAMIIKKSFLVALLALSLAACAAKEPPVPITVGPIFSGKYGDPIYPDGCFDTTGATVPCAPPPTCADGSTQADCVPGGGGGTGTAGTAATG